MAQIVVGHSLIQALKDFKGGNEAYVGTCFEIEKRPAQPGKRNKEDTKVTDLLIALAETALQGENPSAALAAVRIAAVAAKVR